MGCIYGSPKPLSQKIPYGIGLYVIEMNNELNRIEGIGYIHNVVNYDKYFEVYDPIENQQFNSYVFRGKTRMDREYLNRENPELVSILDYILFKEKTHMKRGNGLTRVPCKLLNHEKCYINNNNINIQKEIKILFQKYICHQQIMEQRNKQTKVHPI